MPYVPARKVNTVEDKRGPVKNNKSWPESMRRKAVKTWLQNGSVVLTAKILNIPFDTMESWRYRSSWWKDYVRQYREEADAGMAAKIEKLLEKSVNELEDRVNNGDEVFDSKTGETKRVKMKARDLNNTIKVISDRHDVLTDRAAKETESTEQINEKLSKLADAFTRFAKKGSLVHNTSMENVEDVPFVEVVEEKE